MIASAGGSVGLEEAVEIIVARLLERSGGGPGPATDLKAVAAALNVRGWGPEDLYVAGELRRDGDGFTIAYDAAIGPGRRNFTIAHELGHAFFESTGPGCPKVGEELERICDRFAAALLMPPARLGVVVDSWSPQILLDLATALKVSVSALLFRVEEVADRHAAVLTPDGAVRAASGMIGGPRSAPRPDLAPLAVRSMEGLDATTVLPRNRRWNGEWSLQGRPFAGRTQALVTGIPVTSDGEPDARPGRLIGSTPTSRFAAR